MRRRILPAALLLVVAVSVSVVLVLRGEDGGKAGSATRGRARDRRRCQAPAADRRLRRHAHGGRRRDRRSPPRRSRLRPHPAGVLAMGPARAAATDTAGLGRHELPPDDVRPALRDRAVRAAAGDVPARVRPRRRLVPAPGWRRDRVGRGEMAGARDALEHRRRRPRAPRGRVDAVAGGPRCRCPRRRTASRRGCCAGLLFAGAIAASAWPASPSPSRPCLTGSRSRSPSRNPSPSRRCRRSSWRSSCSRTSSRRTAPQTVGGRSSSSRRRWRLAGSSRSRAGRAMMAWSEDTPTLAETSGLAESVRAQLALLEPEESKRTSWRRTAMRLRRSRRQAVSSYRPQGPALGEAARARPSHRARGRRRGAAGGGGRLGTQTSTCASGAFCRRARPASSSSTSR